MKKQPTEKELDGLSLDRFLPGCVVDVSASVGAWLIAQGYADPEMRGGDAELDFGESVRPDRATANHRLPRRRSTDR
jgi:hypothetical protein